MKRTAPPAPTNTQAFMTKAIIVYYRDKFYTKISGSITTIKHHFRFKIIGGGGGREDAGWESRQCLTWKVGRRLSAFQDKALELAVSRVPEGRGWQRKSHLGSVCRSAGQAGEMCKEHRFDHAQLIRLWLCFPFTGADT